MKTLSYIATISALLLTAQGMAQQAEISRSVEVTKAYRPEADAALKLPTVPRMFDTVALRPEISYSIRPTGWATAFAVKPIAAAGINATYYEKQPAIYLRAGLGAPFQSAADVYVHKKISGAQLGGYFNHEGWYADLKDDAGAEQPAKQSTNAMGVYCIAPAGLRTSIDARLGYSWDYYTLYGLAAPSSFPAMDTGSARAQSYSSPQASVTFGNDFTDLDAVNFRLGLRGGHFADRNDNSQREWGLTGEAARKFSFGKLSLMAGVEGWKGGGNLDGYKNTIWRAEPLYEMQNSRFRLAAGFNFAWDDNMAESKAWVFPRVRLSWDISNGYIVPFIDVDGHLTNNGMRSLAERCPYMAPGMASPDNTARYDMHGGISGSFSSSFSYKAFAGASFYRSHIAMVYFYDEGNTGSFLPAAQDAVQVTVGGEISARIPGGLEALASLCMHVYPENTSSTKVADLPDLEIGLGARYTWRERLTLQAGLDVTGNRYCLGGRAFSAGMIYVDSRIDPVADLHFQADYRVAGTWNLFLRARNLLNMELYPYAHYRGQGINALGGVSVTF